MTTTTDALTARVARALDALAPAGARCLVAVSGGPDSLALLELLHQGAPTHGRELLVGHVDHGIGEGSASVATEVAAHAMQRGLSFHIVQLELGAECSETRARLARRAGLRRLAAEAGAAVIVLGHHADDQAETILLRILRGSGPAGLAGMAARRGPWIRPLLDVPREALAEYLAQRGLIAWHDPANADPRHLRSWLRAEIMPRLVDRLPDLVAKLAESGEQAAAARRAWNAVPAIVPALEQVVSARGISVAAPTLRGYRSGLRHAVLAALGRQFGVPLGVRRLAVLDRLLLGRRGVGVVRLSGRLEAELSSGRLTFQRVASAGASTEVVLEPGSNAVVGEVRIKVVSALAAEAERGGWWTALAPGRYVARTWRPGDRIRPLGGRGSRAVGVLFREAQIPPRRRGRWPVIASGDDATIVWVPGICRADSRIPAPGTEALHVECAFT